MTVDNRFISVIYCDFMSTSLHYKCLASGSWLRSTLAPVKIKFCFEIGCRGDIRTICNKILF